MTAVKGKRSSGPAARSQPAARRARLKQISLRDPSRSLPLALMRAREAVMQYLRPHHRKHGITEQQLRVLRVLYRSGELEATDLARQSMLLAPSLTRILRDLEAAKMISRRWAETDLRRSVIAITPTGVALLAKVAPLSEASFAQITRLYGETRLNQLFKLLNELETALRQPEADEDVAARKTAR